MNFLTYNEYKQKANSTYWRRNIDERWAYMEIVIHQLIALCPTTILEIGTAGLSLCHFSETMDLREKYQPTYLHDANEVPWPITDKSFDVVVALQVWEHLSQQEAAFAEAMRIAHYGIFSFPYLWKCPKDFIHHNITLEEITKWTLTQKPVSSIIVGNDKRQRIVMSFDFRENNGKEILQSSTN